jgi:putative ABC transport system permease protein
MLRKQQHTMWTNYIRTTWRNLMRNKLHAALNLAGLGIGLACCLLIALYVAGELRYDRQHAHAERIWRVTRSFHDADGSENLHLSAIAPPFAGLLQAEFPDIEAVTRLFNVGGTALRVGEKVLQEDQVFFADSNFFRLFSVPLRQGEARSALSAPNQLLLSEQLAQRLFGTQDPLGQTLRVDDRLNAKVTGVFQGFEPGSSHFYPEMLLSFPTLLDSALYGRRRLETDFGNNAFYTYLLVAPHFDPAKMSARFPDFLDKSFPPAPTPSAPKPSSWTKLHLQRLSDIHLHSRHDDELEPGGDYARVRMFGLVALAILLLASINYVNLSTAFSLQRAREIGVRKATGALRRQIMGQFLGESVLLALGAGCLAMGLVAFAAPALRNILEINVLPGGWGHVWQLPLALLGLSLLTGLLAGLYPALFLSAFHPIAALKGRLRTGAGNITLRKSLVVLQFAVSIALLVGTLVIERQLDFMQKKALGLDRERVVVLDNNTALLRSWDAFRQELLQNPNMLSACRSSRLPSGQLLDNLGGSSVQLGDTMSPLTVTMPSIATDLDFVETYRIPLAAGRAFSREYPNDSTQAWLLNEAAVRAIGWKSPEEALGKRLVYGGRQDCKVVGVLRDFHFESLHSEIVPMIFYVPRNRNHLFNVSLKMGNDIPAGLAQLAAVWKKFNPEFPLEYRFLDEDFQRLYAAELRQGRLFSVFSGLAILIACLGLFGLATFAAHLRLKEIGIRKVLGASVAGVTGLLAKDFLTLVLLAALIATPAAYFLMQRWLQDFAYRTDLPAWVFAAAALAALAVAALAVSYQSARAALSNPAQTLKSD